MKKRNPGNVFEVDLIIGVLAVCIVLLLALSPEGTAGLWRKIVSNMLLAHIGVVCGLRVLMIKEKLFNNIILHVLVWIAALAVAAAISVPCFKDFSAEHIVIEVPGSSFDVYSKHFLKDNRYYLKLDTGEEIEISSDHYFSLLGVHDGTLRIEYFPNTMTAVRLSGHN